MLLAHHQLALLLDQKTPVSLLDRDGIDCQHEHTLLDLNIRSVQRHAIMWLYEV